MPSLIQLLTKTGVGSRRYCFELIKNGNVRVNGREQLSAATLIDFASDQVEVNGRLIDDVQPLVYMKLNKPVGVVSTTSDDVGRSTVLDFVPERFRKLRLYPVGRLDVDTSGLVLLTNDGDLANRLTHPRFEVEKEYYALIDAELTDRQLHALEDGVMVQGIKTSRAKVKRMVNRDAPWYSLIIHEGRKHQVRNMFRAVGCEVHNLKRVRIRNLLLGSLKSGKVLELTGDEYQNLSSAISPNLRLPKKARLYKSPQFKPRLRLRKK